MKNHLPRTLSKMTEILALNLANPDSAQMVTQRAIQVLQSGGVIAVPTDTVYGLAAMSQNTAAITKMYDIKGRHDEKPVAICVGHVADIPRWGKVSVPEGLLHSLLPGAVTVVLEREKSLNHLLNPTTSLVGVRVPDHDFIRQLASGAGSPLALTSANPSSAKSTLAIEEFKSLWPSLDLIIDGGVLSDPEASRACSTVVDLSCEGQYSIIRPGSAYSRTVDILKNKYKLTER